jgi:hypothetical protein
MTMPPEQERDANTLMGTRLMEPGEGLFEVPEGFVRVEW